MDTNTKSYKNHPYKDELLLLHRHKYDLEDLQMGCEIIGDLLHYGEGYAYHAEWLAENLWNMAEEKLEQVNKSIDMWEALGNGNQEEN